MREDGGTGVNLEGCQVIQFNLRRLPPHVRVHERPVLGHPNVEDVLDHGSNLFRPGHILRRLADDQFRLHHVVVAGHLREALTGLLGLLDSLQGVHVHPGRRHEPTLLLASQIAG